MATRKITAPAVAQSVDAPPDIQRTIAEALDLLGRASADWKNGTDAVPGPLHWPVAVNLARRQLREVLEALEAERNPAEALIGMSWFNGLSRSERAYWLELAGSARPADAWRTFQAGGAAP
jgi:hypothetical protein